MFRFILRRTQEVLDRYLPPKIETVVFCRPSPLQVRTQTEPRLRPEPSPLQVHTQTEPRLLPEHPLRCRYVHKQNPDCGQNTLTAAGTYTNRTQTAARTPSPLQVRTQTEPRLLPEHAAGTYTNRTQTASRTPSPLQVRTQTEPRLRPEHPHSCRYVHKQNPDCFQNTLSAAGTYTNRTQTAARTPSPLQVRTQTEPRLLPEHAAGTYTNRT